MKVQNYMNVLQKIKQDLSSIRDKEGFNGR